VIVVVVVVFVGVREGEEGERGQGTVEAFAGRLKGDGKSQEQDDRALDAGSRNVKERKGRS